MKTANWNLTVSVIHTLKIKNFSYNDVVYLRTEGQVATESCLSDRFPLKNVVAIVYYY